MWSLSDRKLIKTPANEIFSLFKPLQSGRTSYWSKNLSPLFGCFIWKPISRDPVGKIENVQKKYAIHEIPTYLLTRAEKLIFKKCKNPLGEKNS